MTNPKFEHIMLDIETLGKKSYSVIRSIAAVEFCPHSGTIGRSFYANIDLQSCLDIGLTIDADTILWWMQQSKEAQNAFLIDPKHIADALDSFSKFIRINPDFKIWGNSPRFDCGLIKNAYETIGTEEPWHYRNEMCVRTLKNLYPDLRPEFVGTPHNAIDDCMHQIETLHQIYKKQGL